VTGAHLLGHNGAGKSTMRLRRPARIASRRELCTQRSRCPRGACVPCAKTDIRGGPHGRRADHAGTGVRRRDAGIGRLRLAHRAPQVRQGGRGAGIILGLLAIGLGIAARKEIARDPKVDGDRLALTGMIAGAIGVVLWGVLIATGVTEL
jgi:hypothetical protein